MSPSEEIEFVCLFQSSFLSVQFHEGEQYGSYRNIIFAKRIISDRLELYLSGKALFF